MPGFGDDRMDASLANIDVVFPIRNLALRAARLSASRHDGCQLIAFRGVAIGKLHLTEMTWIRRAFSGGDMLPTCPDYSATMPPT